MSKTYYVTYTVTREEVYRVTAANEADAEAGAFDEGAFIRTEETVNVRPISVKLARFERARLVASNTKGGK